MKNLLILLLVFIAVHSNAQWYTRQFGVNDISELNNEQLNIAFTKAEKTTKAGIAMTVIGLPVMIIGGVMFWNGWNEFLEGDIVGGGMKYNAGALISYAGVLSAGIGIPLWIVGKNRKDIITVHLAKFTGTSYIPSIGIKISF